MKNTIWSKFILCYVISMISIFILMNTYGMHLLENRLRIDAQNRMIEEAKLISTQYTENFYKEVSSISELRLQMHSIETYLKMRVWITDSSGVIIVDSSSVTSAQSLNLNEVMPDYLDNTVNHDIFIKSYMKDPAVSVTRPLYYNYQLRGYVILQTPLHVVTENVHIYLDIFNIFFLMFLPLQFIFFLYLYMETARPLKTITKAAMEYSKGNYNYALYLKGLSEHRDLGAAVSYMADELSKFNDYQKKFVANISHDFRSPLTSIKGYAEAIVDGTIPHEMQDKYLNIILFETDRLTKLTSSLLELNSFENHGAFLTITSFDINHVIKKTAESFEGTCRDRKITLNLVFSSKSLFIDADMGKIQQVLYNLIDNAIKFSHSNSKIKVTVEEKGEKAFVSVKDFGIGIPKESLNKIWDRFYKTDTSRGKDKKGTGLGLSITKEIIQSHNENINVVSTIGVGTEFVFSIKKSEEQYNE